MAESQHRRTRRMRGFEPASLLLQSRIRRAGEARGFAVSRVLTHWAEIVGDEIARVARPVDVRYGRESFGATLTLLTTGAQAPLLEMQKEAIREKVNACYGYAAISKIRITQTAATGFAEAQARFDHKPAEVSPEAARKAHDSVEVIRNDDLRAALEALGRNVLSHEKE
jgi:hypothetical protein